MMKPWAKLTGALGLIGLALGGLHYAFSAQNAQYGLMGAGAGLALVLLAALGSLAYLKAFFGRRSARLGLSAGAGVLVVLAMAAFLGSLAFRHQTRWDLSHDSRHTLASQSVAVLKKLETPVKIFAFFRDSQQGRMEAQDLLEQYAYVSPQFTYQFVDPDRDPALAKRYDIRAYGTVVMVQGERDERVKSADEQAITNALIKLGSPGKKVVYLVTGHGERSTTDIGQEGFAEFKKAAEQQNYEVKPLILAAQDAAPADASLLLLAGPKKPLNEQEKKVLADYLARGGGLMLLLDPEQDGGLSDWLKTRGVELGENVVVDPQSRLFGASPAWPIASEFNDHEITRPLEGTICYFPLARSVTVIEPKPQGISGLPLVRTSATSWAETDLKTLQGGQARFDEGQDVKGPVSLAVLMTITPSAPVQPADKAPDMTPAPAKGRLLVVGDSDFVANAHLNQAGNRDLALNAVSFLADQGDLIAIRPKESASQPLLLSPSQAQVFFWVPVVLVPGFFLVLGLVVVLKRRRPAA
jgi:ABC-type uncharacterized transport system involved in gliding motility auxiliary subunit